LPRDVITNVIKTEKSTPQHTESLNSFEAKIYGKLPNVKFNTQCFQKYMLLKVDSVT